MHKLQKKFLEENIDFINQVIETGKVKHDDEILAEVIYGIYEKEVPTVRVGVESDAVAFEGRLVLSDEAGKYVMVKDPFEVKKAFKEVKNQYDMIP